MHPFCFKNVSKKRTFRSDSKRNVRFRNTYKYLHFIRLYSPMDKENFKPDTPQNHPDIMLTFANMILGNTRNAH